MKIEFCVVGKTKAPYLKEGISIFEKRLVHYNPFSIEIIPDLKNAGKLKSHEVKEKEGEAILKRLKNEDYLILLDEGGKQFTSEEFANQVQSLLQKPNRKIVFQIGGAFGFSKKVYERANHKIGLSKLTFSHQMVRLFFVEQLYRAFTILKNEKYHNK